MVGLLVFLGLLTIGLGVIMLYKYYSNKKWIKETSDWLIDDIIFCKNSDKEYFLKGWSSTHVYLSETNNIVTKYTIDKIDFNKSVIWRRNYDDCESFMGKAPNFKRGLSNDLNTNNSDMIDGKPIELLTEIECQIYLKQVLEVEDYVTASKIREQLKKYR